MKLTKYACAFSLIVCIRIHAWNQLLIPKEIARIDTILSRLENEEHERVLAIEKIEAQRDMVVSRLDAEIASRTESMTRIEEQVDRLGKEAEEARSVLIALKSKNSDDKEPPLKDYLKQSFKGRPDLQSLDLQIDNEQLRKSLDNVKSTLSFKSDLPINDPENLVFVSTVSVAGLLVIIAALVPAFNNDDDNSAQFTTNDDDNSAQFTSSSPYGQRDFSQTTASIPNGQPLSGGMNKQTSFGDPGGSFGSPQSQANNGMSKQSSFGNPNATGGSAFGSPQSQSFGEGSSSPTRLKGGSSMSGAGSRFGAAATPLKGSISKGVGSGFTMPNKNKAGDNTPSFGSSGNKGASSFGGSPKGGFTTVVGRPPQQGVKSSKSFGKASFGKAPFKGGSPPNGTGLQ